MSFEREVPSEATFERRLLESARKDARPHDVQSAWARFAGVLGQVVPDPGGGRVGDSKAKVGAPATVAAIAGSRTTWGTAMKWLLLGAIGGGGLTAGLLNGRRDGKVESSPSAVGRALAPPGQAIAPTRPPGLVASDPGGPSAARDSRHEPRSRPRATTPRGVSSTLAAEVSRIDTARIASSSGDYDEALRLVERYHRDFPEGALAPDADVVALEAAAAKRDRAEIARRTALFLSRYPGDPHAARVRWLAAHPVEGGER